MSNLYPSKIGHLEVDLAPRRSRFSDSRPIGRIPVPIAEPRNIGVKACVWEEGSKIIRFFFVVSLSLTILNETVVRHVSVFSPSQFGVVRHANVFSTGDLKSISI